MSLLNSVDKWKYQWKIILLLLYTSELHLINSMVKYHLIVCLCFVNTNCFRTEMYNWIGP